MKNALYEILFVITLAFFCIFLFACGSVTETGNPCPIGDCTELESPGEGDVYINNTYGVSVYIPNGWSVEERDSDTAQFTDNERPATNAVMHFEELSPVPSSLSDYLALKYPERTFSVYDTGSISGFVYDNPAIGDNGGDAREYYFLSGAVFIQTEAEAFTQGELGLEELLAGIVFQ